MAKFAADFVMDRFLSTIVEEVTKITVCSGQPATFSAANLLEISGGDALAFVNVSAGSFAALAVGDVDGRKLTINAHSGLTVSATGGGNHVALLKVSTATLYYVTTATSQTLTAGNQLTINAWDIEIADPV
jgi:hypothetical protein